MTQLPPFERSLPMLLLRAREASMQRFRPLLNAHGVTEQQWRVIRTLGDLGESTPSELAQECALLGPSVTRILSALDDLGYVERTQDAGDRRRVLVRATALGHQLIEAVRPEVAVVYDEIDTVLGDLGLDRLLDHLDTLITGLDAAGTRVADVADRRTA